MVTNKLKKGTIVSLRNGWKATLEDNKKGNIRMATVYGDYTEMGSVYSHDIMSYQDSDGTWHPVEHTTEQLKCRAMNQTLFGD